MAKKCEKCNYESEENIDVMGRCLCSVCKKFAPHENINEYIREKLNWRDLETFRKFENKNKNIEGMKQKAKGGNIVSRAPFGYKIVNKKLEIDEEERLIVEEIFQTFLSEDISLNSLAKKYGFSVNGIKKILRNFTYIGKVKFAGQIIQGKHETIITPELFNKVQNKLEKLGIR
jgi:hypothetical protein